MDAFYNQAVITFLKKLQGTLLIELKYIQSSLCQRIEAFNMA